MLKFKNEIIFNKVDLTVIVLIVRLGEESTNAYKQKKDLKIQIEEHEIKKTKKIETNKQMKRKDPK
jgi:hypothetical protein